MGLAGGLLAQNEGAVHGAAVTEDNQPLVNVRVTATRQYAEGVSAFSLSATTRPDGAFSLEGLPPGTYRVCVHAPAGMLDPCHWSQTPPTVTLAPGEVVDTFRITVPRGALVKVRLKDAGKLLSKNEGKKADASVLVGVWTDRGLFYPAAVVAEDSGGRDHAITVPYDLAVTLSAHSKFFKLADATPGGAAAVQDAKGGLRMSVKQTGRDKPPKEVTVEVTGVVEP